MSGVLIALDTSTSAGSVAVGRAGRVLAEVTLAVRGRMAEQLVPAIGFVLGAAGATMDEVAGVVVAGGPGSFTGVRIAAATAKGLVYARGVPLLAYSSLLAQAAGAASPDRPVCAMFDARRDEVYAGCWRFPSLDTVEEVLAPCAAPLEEVAARLAEANELSRMRGSPASTPLYVGDGAVKHRVRLDASGGRVPPAHGALPRASGLLWLAKIAPELGRVADAAAWEPEYLRASGAERVAAET